MSEQPVTESIAVKPPAQVLPFSEITASLYEQGLCLIPVQHGGKKPLVDWKEYQHGQPSEEELCSWASRFPQCNWAAVCGSISANLVIQDFEGYDAFAQFYDPQNISRETVIVRTPGGGVHDNWQCLKACPRRTIRLSQNPPLDLLGEGGYALVPPSKVNGKQYTLIGTTKIATVTGDLAEATQKRCAQLGWKTTPKLSIGEIQRGVPQGFRNNSAFQYARHLLFTAKLDRDTAWFELQRWNGGNSPPLGDEELAAVLESASKYAKQTVADRLRRHLGVASS